MGKQFRIDCGPAAAELLIALIRTYAQAAYPPGGSECAQAAREALQDAADQLQQQQGRRQPLTANIRLRAMLKSAVRWYLPWLSESGFVGAEELTAPLLDCLAGKPLADDRPFENLLRQLAGQVASP